MFNRADIVVFGASGFTGEYTLPFVYELTKEKELTWCIAGRSEQKLKDVLKNTAKRVGLENLDRVPIFIANVLDEKSLLQMTSKAKVLINCCGPFQKYGEPVVKACVESGTHYLDVSGEFYFNEVMEIKYDQAARGKGVYIVNGCGYDSVAAEFCLNYLNRKFPGTLNSVELYFSYDAGTPPAYHFGTWESLINVFPLIKEHEKLQKTRNLQPLPDVKPYVNHKLPLSKAVSVNEPHKTIVPYITIDHYMMQRSERYFYENFNKRPTQIKLYGLVNSWFSGLMALILSVIYSLLWNYDFGRKLLLHYPEFFSGGYFSRQKPTEESTDSTYVTIQCYGEGWGKEVGDVQNECTVAPDKAIISKVTFINPGYKFCGLIVTLGAVTLLTETTKLPPRGGVFTPAVTFNKTSYMEEVQIRSKCIMNIQLKNL